MTCTTALGWTAMERTSKEKTHTIDMWYSVTGRATQLLLCVLWQHIQTITNNPAFEGFTKRLKKTFKQQNTDKYQPPLNGSAPAYWRRQTHVSRSAVHAHKDYSVCHQMWPRLYVTIIGVLTWLLISDHIKPTSNTTVISALHIGKTERKEWRYSSTYS